jgi:hypothetical protein
VVLTTTTGAFPTVGVGDGTGVGVAVGIGVGDGRGVAVGIGLAVGAGVGVGVAPLLELFSPVGAPTGENDGAQPMVTTEISESEQMRRTRRIDDEAT